MQTIHYEMELVANKEKWDLYFLQSYFPNLLQSWSYGEAKAICDGLMIQRGIIKNKGVPIALCQWLEKPILKLGCIVRINRGPIWLNHVPDNQEREAVYCFLRKYFSILRGI